MSKIWDRYVQKSVLVQLRTQPYIGVSGMLPQPIMDEAGNFANTAILTGIVTEVMDGYLVLKHPDPLDEEKRRYVYTQLNCDRDVGYISVTDESRIIS